MRGTPSLVLIDRQGLIRKHAFGSSDDLRIGAEIGALTQERLAAPVGLASAPAGDSPSGVGCSPAAA
jgi:hypothetical protein